MYRILIAEDDISIRTELNELLKNAGYETVFARSVYSMPQRANTVRPYINNSSNLR